MCAYACVQERQLDQAQFGLRVKRVMGQRTETCTAEPTEPLRDLVGTSLHHVKPVGTSLHHVSQNQPGVCSCLQVYDELEVFSLPVFTVMLTLPDSVLDFGKQRT